jgi:hypothetical protein
LRKADDSSLTPDQYRKVRKEAEKLLAKADAIGRFPTPVEDLLLAADVAVAPEDALSEGFLRTLRKKASSALKRALSKVLGIFSASARLIYVDGSLGKSKQTFIKLHETGHGMLPWQRGIYAVVEDCSQTLDPDVAEAFDREANNFATEVLFQLDEFIKQARDDKFGLRSPLTLSKKFGASAYSAIRQYVTKSGKPCVVIVLNPPELQPLDGFCASLRRVVASPLFVERFGDLTLPDVFTPDDKFGAMVPLGGRRMTGPHELVMTDRNGTAHDCLAEAFGNPYNVFILIYPVKALTKTIVIF